MVTKHQLESKQKNLPQASEVQILRNEPKKCRILSALVFQEQLSRTCAQPGAPQDSEDIGADLET
jgi:hypothetical protein